MATRSDPTRFMDGPDAGPSLIQQQTHTDTHQQIAYNGSKASPRPLFGVLITPVFNGTSIWSGLTEKRTDLRGDNWIAESFEPSEFVLVMYQRIRCLLNTDRTPGNWTSERYATNANKNTSSKRTMKVPHWKLRSSILSTRKLSDSNWFKSFPFAKLDLREHSSILTNGVTLLRSEIDSLIASVCCT